jgi:hypothetical protein
MYATRVGEDDVVTQMETRELTSGISESQEAVLAHWSEHRAQLRQSEAQRAVLTNVVLAITAGLSGFIVARDFAPATVALAFLIMVMGLFGAVSTAKHHERAAYHLAQARALTTTLRGMGGLADESNLEEFRQAHNRLYPWLHRIQLHALWTGLHLVVALYGFVIFIVILSR